MRADNYRAWEVDVKNFPYDGSLQEKIKFLLNFGLLAPSGHNSQPWQCKIVDNVLEITHDKDRSLADSDPEERLLNMSLGCFVENIVIAANYFDLNPEVNTGDGIYIAFRQGSTDERSPNHLVFQIKQRHSNRFKYKDQNPSSEFIRAVQKLETDNQKVFFLETKKNLEVADIILGSQIKTMDSTAFRRELSNYVKSSFTKHGYGMPGFTLDMPALFSVIAPPLFKKINFSKLAAKKDSALFKKYTPIIGVIAAEKDTRETWIEIGRLLERVWLEATSSGLVMSIWAAPIQQPDFRKLLQNHLDTKLLPMMTFRLGYPTVDAKPSPRLHKTKILPLHNAL